MACQLTLERGLHNKSSTYSSATLIAQIPVPVPRSMILGVFRMMGVWKGLLPLATRKTLWNISKRFNSS